MCMYSVTFTGQPSVDLMISHILQYIDILHSGDRVQYDLFGSEEMLLQKPEASAITFSEKPKKNRIPRTIVSCLFYYMTE